MKKSSEEFIKQYEKAIRFAYLKLKYFDRYDHRNTEDVDISDVDSKEINFRTSEYYGYGSYGHGSASITIEEFEMDEGTFIKHMLDELHERAEKEYKREIESKLSRIEWEKEQEYKKFLELKQKFGD